MNGSLTPADFEVIKLKRGPTGLGFNIVGGLDQPYVLNDTGIYVSKIKEDGAAALDGRLREGDKILSINGVVLEDMPHKQVVDLFKRAGNHVELRVVKKTNSTRHPWRPQNGNRRPCPSSGFCWRSPFVRCSWSGSSAPLTEPVKTLKT